MYNPTTFSTIDELNKCRKIEDLYREEWRDIPNFRGYQASNFGRIKKLPELICQFRGQDVYSKPKIVSLRRGSDKHPYQRAPLVKDGQKKYYYVHRLVLMAFRGEDKEHPHGHHINHNPADNRLENLQWVTHQENLQYASEFHTEQARRNMQNKAWPNHYSKLDSRHLR